MKSKTKRVISYFLCFFCTACSGETGRQKHAPSRLNSEMQKQVYVSGDLSEKQNVLERLSSIELNERLELFYQCVDEATNTCLGENIDDFDKKLFGLSLPFKSTYVYADIVTRCNDYPIDGRCYQSDPNMDFWDKSIMFGDSMYSKDFSVEKHQNTIVIAPKSFQLKFISWFKLIDAGAKLKSKEQIVLLSENNKGMASFQFPESTIMLKKPDDGTIGYALVAIFQYAGMKDTIKSHGLYRRVVWYF
jgi:hypothetical protein